MTVCIKTSVLILQTCNISVLIEYLLCACRLKMLCSWTKWKSNKKRVFPSLLPRHPTTKRLCSPSRLLGPRQMEEGRLVVRLTSTLRTAPRTLRCCLSPPQASWQQVSLILDGEASGLFGLRQFSCLQAGNSSEAAGIMFLGCPSIRLSHSCKLNISGMHWGNFFKFGTMSRSL